jgi:hypothetical protein
MTLLNFLVVYLSTPTGVERTETMVDKVTCKLKVEKGRNKQPVSMPRYQPQITY